MASKLEKAVEIYRSLGYEETDFDDILKLGTGKQDEEKIAREGLKSGEWTEIKQLSPNSYGFVPVVDVDLDKLAIFAIRVGVDARRAANVVSRSSEVALRAIEARGKSYAINFINAASSSNRRSWEHSLSRLGMLSLKLLHRMNLAIPESVDYMKDWAAGAAVILGIRKKDYTFDDDFVLEKEELLRRFCEHIEAGISVNVPATGPFSEVLIWGVENGILDRDQALEQVFYGLQIAQRPGDRKAFINVLEQIGLSDDEIRSRAESILPLLGLGETPILERFAPILIESASEDFLYPLLISCTSAKTKKVKKMILQSVLKREKAMSAEAFAEWILPYKQQEDADIARLAAKLEPAWGLSVEVEDHRQGLRGLWQKTPKLWEVPSFEIGEISPEKLTDLLSEIAARRQCVEDLNFERFLAMANRIAYENPQAAKISLGGIPTDGSGGLLALACWVKGLGYDCCPDRMIRDWNGGREVSRMGYGELLYARRSVLFATIDRWPCLLSTPGFEDLSIRLTDLLERLERYEGEHLPYVSEPDLQLALTRLDLELLAEEKTRKSIERLESLHLQIQLPSGEILQDARGNAVMAGEIIAAYLEDPYVEPAFVPGKTPYWRIIDFAMPQSLGLLPNRFSYSCSDLFSIFPNGGDFSLTAVRRECEVYHGQGLILRQIARRKKPIPKGALMNWIAVWGNLTEKNAADVIRATHEAWERGLLLPQLADASYLDWTGGEPCNLASLALAMENLANEGLLSLLWQAACDLVAASLAAPRMLAGTAELVKFLRDDLEEMVLAVQKDLAPQELLEMRAVEKLAARTGSSKAVSYAREVIDRRNTLAPEPAGDAEACKKAGESHKATGIRAAAGPGEAPDDFLPPVDFEQVWRIPHEGKEPIEDQVTFCVKRMEVRKKEKAFQFYLQLPDISDYRYQVTLYGWFYGISEEGQLSGIELKKGEEVAAGEGREVWLHYDPDRKKLVVSRFRNWRKGKNGPLDGGATPYSKIFLTIALASLAQDGESIYGAKSLVRRLVNEGDLSCELLRDITRELLAHEAISPAKLIRIIEKENELLSVFWVMLSECISHAGARTLEEKKPPVWVNRVLDIAIYDADYLREAVKRGYIPEEDGIWKGLFEISNSTAKSTAVKKAKSLLGKLGKENDYF